MPHSSGGGSSHGGGHSGGSGYHGHSSGGSSSSASRPRPQVYDDYRPGRHVYVRYDYGRPLFRYSNMGYSEATSSWRGEIIRCVIGILVVTLLCIVPITAALDYALRAPARLTYGQAACTIEDGVDVFTPAEEAEIEAAAQDYYDLTGIPITIETISQETFETSGFYSLETYAYHDYVVSFDNEDQWLIVFELEDDGGWAFEGMQGDNTDDWLTEDFSSDFNDTLSEELWRSDGSYGGAFATAIRELAGKGYQIDWETVIMMGVFDAIMIFTDVSLVVSIVKHRKEKAELGGFHEVKATNGGTGPLLVTCDYCGGTYVFGETSCPHCAAPGKTTPG